MIIIPVLLEQCDFESGELCPKTVDCNGGLVQLSLRALKVYYLMALMEWLTGNPIDVIEFSAQCCLHVTYSI